VFLGETELARLDELCALAGSIQAKAFNLNLKQLGFWPHNRIAWVGADETPAELGALVEQLREKLRGAGFRFDHKPFVPHITLLRKADCRNHPLPAEEIEWRAAEFVLVRSALSENGAAYDVVGRWKLS
jgi:2'-5' RNA ligase